MRIQEHINKMGYRDDSPYKDFPALTIESPNISTVGVSKTLIGIGDNGKIQVMKPNKNYYYPNTQSVVEIPIKQKGGNIMKKTRGQNFLGQFEQYLGSLTDTSQNEIMDYVDSLTEQERFKFLHGGVAKWREFQRGGMVKENKDYVEEYLTEEEIKQYIQKGYKVEYL